MSVLYLIMATAFVATILLLLYLWKTLLQAKKDLKNAKDNLDAKDKEMEVVKDVQDALKSSKDKMGPERVAPPNDGDSASRLDRLNRL